MVSFKLLLCTAFLSVVSGTSVDQCPGHSIEGLSDAVSLTPCSSPPCKLKKGTRQHITVKFTPKTDIKDLKNHVTARVFGAELPFVGVDGMSINDKIYTENGEKASFPLQAGTNYSYKDHFDVYDWYPELETTVHWSFGNNLICFELPVKIKK